MTLREKRKILVLIQHVQDTSFECGDYKEGSKPYKFYFDRASKAKDALVEAIERLKEPTP